MSIALREGVHLHVFPSSKFKTVHMSIHFKNQLTASRLSKRSLLARMMQVACQRYPNPKKMTEAQSHLYGARYGTSSSRMGNLHVLTHHYVFPNSRFLPGQVNMAQENLDFVKEVLFHPLANDGAFDAQLFQREKENLIQDIRSISDDKQYYALVRLDELYYPDLAHQIPSMGQLEEIEAMDSSQLYDAYVDMIEQDEVDIFVLGDVDESAIHELLDQLPFSNRPTKDLEVIYRLEEKAELVTATDIQDVQQAKFNLAYSTPIYIDQENYFLGLVFNGLFGAFPHSKLFVNVREKESLAYTASSSLSSLTGKLTVQTGIDAKDHSKANQIIADQLEAMQAGDFSELDFQQTIKMLTNNRYQSDDSPSRFLNRAYRDLLVRGGLLPIEDWLSQLNQVTPEDVVDVAQQVELKASYLLRGGSIDGEVSI